MDQYPDSYGVITADANGQYLLADVQKITDTLRENSDKLILGCRDFKTDGIPWKSKIGNSLTKTFFAFFCGVNVSDTQTGLRGIPFEALKIFIHIPGERYEYETNMLLECNNDIQILEVPITTVYDSKTTHKTHFNPLKDSIAIYKVIMKYSLSSILASVIDMLVFSLAIWQGCSIWASTAMARIMSAFANFLLNKNVVFKACK